jgi:hypothetical protein
LVKKYYFKLPIPLTPKRGLIKSRTFKKFAMVKIYSKELPNPPLGGKGVHLFPITTAPTIALRNNMLLISNGTT